MSKKITPLNEYISARDAASLLSKKLGRPVRRDYIRKLKNVRYHRVNPKCILYNRIDIQAATIKQQKRQTYVQ